MPKGCYLALALGVALAPVAVCERTAQAAAPTTGPSASPWASPWPILAR
jgi:hypothetical protein